MTAFGPLPVGTEPTTPSAPPVPMVNSETVLSAKFATYTSLPVGSMVMNHGPLPVATVPMALKTPPAPMAYSETVLLH
jgi:hypothetical protein